MDDRRFDSLARAVAGNRSRRRLLRGLIGFASLLAAGRQSSPVTAQSGRIGPGEPCRDSSQCLGADAPLVCGENGFDYDGALNCCTFEGNRCGFDEACCGQARCVNGRCASVPDIRGPGEPCRDTTTCIAADAPLTCDYAASTGDFRCCTYAGSRCGSNAACCGSASCINGVCSGGAVVPQSTVAGPGDPCNPGTQCLAADTALACDYVVWTDDFRCCAYEGSRCGTDAGCCGGASCVNGFCATSTPPSGPPAGPGDPCNPGTQCLAADTALACDYVAWTDDFRCCAYEGSRCGFDAGCCGSASCVNGFCTSSTSGEVAGPGDPCNPGTQCLAADTALACDYVAFTNDLRCCAYEGSRCGWDGGCCGWLRCGSDGFCAG